MVLFLWPTQKKNSPRHPALLVPLCWRPSFWHCEDLHLAFYEHTPQRPSLRSTHSPSRLRSCITQESWTLPLDVKEKQRHIWYRPILPPVKTSGLNPPVTSRSYPYQARTLWPVPFGKWPRAAEASRGQGTSASLQLYLYMPRRTALPPATACVCAREVRGWHELCGLQATATLPPCVNTTHPP